MKKHQLLFLTTLFLLAFICSNSFAQVLKPGDGVQITFLDIKDNISGDYFVQPDGKVQLPFIGIIDVNNKDVKEVKREIITKYDSLYRDPQLFVHALFRINILGEVKNPGYYYVREDETIAGILALAGGVTNSGDIESVYIIRDNKEYELNMGNVEDVGKRAIDFGLKSGDQIYVPRTWWADARGVTIIISAAALIVTVLALFLR